MLAGGDQKIKIPKSLNDQIELKVGFEGKKKESEGNNRGNKEIIGARGCENQQNY
jgi:hypothetical protein